MRRPSILSVCLLAAAANAQARPPYAPDRPLPAPELFAPGVISTGDDESHPTFSADGRTLYFLKNTPTFNHWTVVISRWRDGRWSTPEVAPFSGRWADADVSFTPDERRLYFISNRPTDGDAARKDTEIWAMERRGDGWDAPQHLRALGSDTDEWFPTPNAKGDLYFGSSRPGGQGGSDLWVARRTADGFAEPQNLGPPVNSAGDEIEAFVDPDERFLIFASNRPGGAGSYDLYVSLRERGRWGAPRNLGTPINTAGWEFSPRLTPDGRTLYFTSNRGFADRPLPAPLDFATLTKKLRAPGNGLRDIYRIDAGALGLPLPKPQRSL